MKAVGYVRLSQESDTSIKSQIGDIKRYCKEHGYELVKVFNEGEKVSGWENNREQFEKLMKYVEGGNADVVVVRDGSRLGRVFKDRLYWLLYFDKLGVEVHTTLNGKIDPDNPQALLVESVKAYADDVVKRGEIERSRREIQKRKERGLPLGRPPYGLQYSRDKTHFVPTTGFDKAIQVIKLRDEGWSWNKIREETGVAVSTCRRIYLKKEKYKEVMGSQLKAVQA